MCGIVGYIGKRSAGDILINGLKRLEYRGYDSAGIALNYNSRLTVAKQSGKVVALESHLGSEVYAETVKNASCGIAHTRWATHGLPTEENAHPHLDNSGKIALVHNGIIENYAALRSRLIADGSSFKSETDTEVLAHLVGSFYTGDLMAAVSEALKMVEGTYGIAVLSVDHPDEMIVARKGSPLLIGMGNDESIIASDVSAIVAHTQQVIYLQDGDIARITGGGTEIFTLDRCVVNRNISNVEWEVDAAEKSGYEHFMLKEIVEQPTALQNTIRGRLDPDRCTAVLAGLNLEPRDMASIKRIVIVACGTSMHAGMVSKYLFEGLADLPTSVEQAAEFRYCNPLVGADDLVIAVSQSGETADTLAAVRESIQKGALVAGLCNVVGSTIARETGRGIYLHAGPEIGVASTKAFTAQVTVLLMMALKFGRRRRLSREAGKIICDEIRRIPSMIEKVIEQNDVIASIAERYARVEHAFFIGRGILYPAALEGALKLKEISYIHAEGYQAAELKHGPIALLEESTPVIALLNDIPGKEKTLGNVAECRARKAPVLGIVTEGDQATAASVNDAVFVPECSVYAAPLISVVALQLFAYHVARIRGCEIDQPRNLAKSVTVE
ncbi:MAG: glutamine--fructose-6-phosphate transaminase (isomerizing) [Kiritimatiellia bacterium]